VTRDKDFDDVPLYSKILDELFQGGTAEDATIYRGNKRLPTVGDPRPFDSVVSLCAYTLPVGWLVKEMRFAFPDGPLEPWTIPQIEAVAEWVHQQWKAGDRVLIRCQAGMNRSSLVTALVLMREGMSVDAAIEVIRKQRSVDCLSNLHFVEYLQNRGTNDH
jgi:hypothetical protein